MDNIKLLLNMPTEVYNLLLNYFKETNIEYEVWTPGHHAYQVPLEDRREIRKIFPLPPKDIHMYKVLPAAKTTPHYDRGRKSCLQVPCNTHQGFQTFSQRNNVDLIPIKNKTHRPPKEGEKIKMLTSGPLFFRWDDDKKFEIYNTDKPYLQNAAKAHGGFNKSNIDRYFWSISYIEDYDYVCDAYKEWV